MNLQKKNKLVIILSIFFIFILLLINIKNNNNKKKHYIKYSHIQLKRQSDLHFRIKGKINQLPVIFLLDTGASYIAVSPLVAKMSNLKYIETTVVSTASGNSNAHLTLIKQLKLGNIYIKNVKAIITPGLMEYEVLLGQNVLKYFKISQVGNYLSMSTI